MGANARTRECWSVTFPDSDSLPVWTFSPEMHPAVVFHLHLQKEMWVGVPVGSVKGKNKLIVSRLKNAASVPH